MVQNYNNYAITLKKLTGKREDLTKQTFENFFHQKVGTTSLRSYVLYVAYEKGDKDNRLHAHGTLRIPASLFRQIKLTWMGVTMLYNKIPDDINLVKWTNYCFKNNMADLTKIDEIKTNYDWYKNHIDSLFKEQSSLIYAEEWYSNGDHGVMFRSSIP